jgi:hypothetical protein
LQAVTTADPTPETEEVPPAGPGNMPENEAKEQFQIGYVQAIAAVARCGAFEPRPDVDGIDLAVRQLVHQGDVYSHGQLDLQLKASSLQVVKDDHVVQKLKKKHYDVLRTTQVHIPRLLVTLALPEGVAAWHDQSEAELRLMKCAYWMSLRGMPATDQASITVKIPRSNVFNVDALQDLLYMVRAGQVI